MTSPVQPGDRFGRLVVRAFVRAAWVGRFHRTVVWKCDCDCGGERDVQQNQLTGRRWAVTACVACMKSARRAVQEGWRASRRARARAA